MGEKGQVVETLRMEYVCDECGVGMMKPTGGMLMTYPPKYPHICISCSYVQNFKQTYPVIRYKFGSTIYND